MRAFLLAAFAVIGAESQFNRLSLPSFSCGNIARYSPRVNDHTAATTWKIYVWDEDGNVATHFTSSYCNADPVAATFPSVDSCINSCKNARGCASKVWSEHCDQGCEKDCAAHQENVNWKIFSIANTYTKKINVKFSVTAGSIGNSYTCQYTASELLSGETYCVGMTAGSSRRATWPPTDPAEMDQLGQPWVKLGMEASNDHATSAGTAYADANGALVDSPTTSGVSDADRITGVGQSTTCDGHCGTFAPAFGASCTHKSANDVANLGPGWHPSTASDCYCSCTTDCRIVGDCCDDYDLCGPFDLTQVGGIVATQSPTKNAALNIGGATGDPFTEHAGKRTQFYLPLDRRVSLLRYKGVELLGEAKPSKKRNDDQQWFKGFEVRYNGEQIMVVYAAETHNLFRKAAVASEEDDIFKKEKSTESDELAALKDRLARAKMELRATAKMRSEAGSDNVDVDTAMAGPTSRKALRSGQKPLSTLNVTFMGKKLAREVANMSTASGDITIAIVQDANKQIGTGFMESAWIEAPGIGFQLQSSLAQKFPKMEDKIDHMHINLKFNELNASACTGPLPEIWGVQPMSEDTIKMLQPLSKQQ